MSSSKKTINIDITDLYKSKAKTGIQRVVREISQRLVIDAREDFTVRLLAFDATKHMYEVFDNKDVYNYINGKIDNMEAVKTIKIESLGKSDVMFDVDSSWNIPLKRPYLYEKLKKQQVYIITYLYDLVPIHSPQYAHENTVRNFITFISAVYAYTDLVMCDSRSTEKDFLELKDSIGVKRQIPTVVTKLGADFIKAAKPTEDEIKSIEHITNKKYVLFVGTLEPRKRHDVAIDAFDHLVKLHGDINMVFVGKMGWKSEKLLKKLKRNAQYNKRLYWVDNASDATLAHLYKNAYMGLYLSSYEGFGLPIAEPLAYGKITIASRNSSMFEVGKEFADYTYYTSASEVANIIDTYITNDDLRAKRELYITNHYKPYLWDKVYETIFRVLSNIETANAIKQRVKKKKLQFVFISNAPAKLARNITLLDERVSFVKEYIVVAPASNTEKINKIVSANKIVHITDEDILGDSIDRFKKADHVGKNWMLRAMLSENKLIDQEFIMLDDDNQPLVDIDITTFINKDGTYNGYYFYDLPKWPHYLTSFDRGLQSMKGILDEYNLELLAYSSHQPQIINKEIFKEAIKLLDPSISNPPGDEWSTYFNYGATRYPALFNKHIFKTLNWPARPTDWQNTYMPTEYLFENYYDHLYDDKKEVYYGLERSNVAEKFNIKDEQLEPINRAKDLNAEFDKTISSENIIHGPIMFAFKDTELYVSGMPYIVVTARDSILRLDLNFQLISDKPVLDEILLCCEVRGVSIGQRVVAFGPQEDESAGYNKGLISLPFISKKPGVYDTDIFLKVNGRRVYGNTRGIVKLVVVDAEETIESTLRKYV